VHIRGCGSYPKLRKVGYSEVWVWSRDPLLTSATAYISQERLQLQSPARAVCVVHSMQPLPNHFGLLLSLNEELCRRSMTSDFSTPAFSAPPLVTQGRLSYMGVPIPPTEGGLMLPSPNYFGHLFICGCFPSDEIWRLLYVGLWYSGVRSAIIDASCEITHEVESVCIHKCVIRKTIILSFHCWCLL